MKYYSLDVDEVLNSLNSYESGLSLNEADIRLKKYGKILRATSLDELPELIARTFFICYNLKIYLNIYKLSFHF